MSSSILAQTTTTTTRLVQIKTTTTAAAPRLAVSKEYYNPNNTFAEAENVAHSLVESLLPLRHPNIVTMRRIDVSPQNNAIHMTSDFLSNAGDLHNILQTRLRSGVYLSESEVLPIFVQIALGLKYLHDHYICHGLLHPRNILVQQSQSNGGTKGTGLVVRLTDFGVAHVCGNDIVRPPNPLASYRPAPSAEPSLSCASDMWSLGIVLYEMVGLTVPFLGIHLADLERRALRGIVPPLPSGATCRPALQQLMQSLLNPDPLLRPDINVVLRLPIVQQYVQQLVASMASRVGGPVGDGGSSSSSSVPVVRVTRRAPSEMGAVNDGQRRNREGGGRSVGNGKGKEQVKQTEEERQLLRLRKAREEAHRERLVLQQKYQQPQQQPHSSSAVRSVGSVQRSPTAATGSPPQLPLWNQQQQPRRQPSSGTVKVHGHVISSPALRRKSASGSRSTPSLLILPAVDTTTASTPTPTGPLWVLIQ
jgi:serine/threonine protein kinase